MYDSTTPWNCSSEKLETESFIRQNIITILAFLVMVINGFVAVALIRSWAHLRQNLYIFALSISVCDALLGFVHFISGIVALFIIKNEVENDDVRKFQGITDVAGPQSWFYIIRTSVVLFSEISSTGQAALLAVAFERYVVTLAPSRDDNSSNSRGLKSALGKNRSILLSRKTSYKLTIAVWVLSVIVGTIPLFYNCGKECSCFLERGIMGGNEEAFECFKANGCSYLIPPLMSIYNILVVIIFFAMLTVMTVASIKVMIAAGGMHALLPYKIHQKYLRNKKIDEENFSGRQQTHRRLRSHSVQMSYMRNMMHFMFALTFSCIIFRLPGNIVLLVEAMTQERLRISLDVARVVIIIGIANSLVTPIIFATTLHGMRGALKRVFECGCCVKVVDVKIGKSVYSTSADDTRENEHSLPKA